MSIDHMIGSLLRMGGVQEIVGWQLAFAATWAARHPLRVVAACLACVAAAVWFYVQWQPRLARGTRAALALLRGATLALVAVLLADPVLEVAVRHGPRPTLWLLFDGTESMAIRDARGEGDAAGNPADDGPSRQEQVAAWLQGPDRPLAALAERFRLRAYLLESADAVRQLDTGTGDGAAVDGGLLAGQLAADGRVTAIGRWFEELAQRRSGGSLQGVVMVSDFDQNAGPPAAEAARRLGVPVHTVGVGPAAAADLAVQLVVPPMMKKAEQATVAVTLRQTGFEGGEAAVTVTARLLDGPLVAGQEIPVGARTVVLAGPNTVVDLPFVPRVVGRHEFIVEVDGLAGERVVENNRAVREATVRDDYLRLMYVEDEPTWEWRFVKEVFHRDELVGMRGFRTFLRSADPLVRQTNELFLPTPTPPRSEFFRTDVIFLGDVPGRALSARFCELTREFVERFGGGLVVIAGSRFGPGAVMGTPLADMLPVVLDGDSRLRDDGEFRLRLTPDAALVDFMQLGGDEEENGRAWANLGPLTWYQPVARPHPQATVLATHPSDTCRDGRTPQPLIAIRRFGRGEVVYLGFNETWRLRKKYGERYYRQFWGQMIHRLGLSHAPGDQKRFIVRSDAARYETDDTAILSVEAYDANFEPLAADSLPDRAVMARLLRPQRTADGLDSEPIALPQVRSGVFEARVPLAEDGDYRLLVTDPLTREESEVSFTVTAVSAERRGVVRNVALQQAIASETGGTSCELADASRVLKGLEPSARPEKALKAFPLGMTWPCLGIGIALMVAEWTLRKWANLT